MAFQPVPDTVQVEVKGLYFGEEVENTFYYLYPTTPTAAQVQDLVDALGAVVLSEFVPNLPTAWEGVQVYARGLSTPLDVQATNLDILGVDGTLSGTPQPGNVTIALSRNTGLTGKSGHGRIYWMGLGAAYVTGNQITTAGAGFLLGALADLDAAAVAEGWTPVLVSRQQAGVVLATGLTYPLVGWNVEDFALDSQRRRLQGRGS